MDKRILDLVNDFSQWKGNTYTLANLIVELQKDLDRKKLVEAGFSDAAEVI